MKKYFIFLIIIVSIILAFPVHAEVITNSGFIPGQIWYSNEPLIEGETVNIHTAVWNGEKESLSVKVEFYDKNVILGSRDVILSPSELKDVDISWKITAGDHVISAKITSSIITISGQNEKVVLSRIITSNDKQFVPVSNADLLKTQIDKTSAEINNILPENVSDSISNSFVALEDFRNEKYTKIVEVKDETKKEIEEMKNEDKSIIDKVTEKTNIQDATKEPITYIKLFLFSTLAFIFSNKIVFYGIIILIAFLILRKIYRAIRNR